jgi:hypothetical protein
MAPHLSTQIRQQMALALFCFVLKNLADGAMFSAKSQYSSKLILDLNFVPTIVLALILTTIIPIMVEKVGSDWT